MTQSIIFAIPPGFTALHHASQEGHLPVVELLVEQGCGLEVKTNAGESARVM